MVGGSPSALRILELLPTYLPSNSLDLAGAGRMGERYKWHIETKEFKSVAHV